MTALYEFSVDTPEYFSSRNCFINFGYEYDNKKYLYLKFTCYPDFDIAIDRLNKVYKTFQCEIVNCEYFGDKLDDWNDRIKVPSNKEDATEASFTIKVEVFETGVVKYILSYLIACMLRMFAFEELYIKNNKWKEGEGVLEYITRINNHCNKYKHFNLNHILKEESYDIGVENRSPNILSIAELKALNNSKFLHKIFKDGLEIESKEVGNFYGHLICKVGNRLSQTNLFNYIQENL